MRKVRFALERVRTAFGTTDLAYVDEGEDVPEAVMRAVWDDLKTDVDVTISGVTMMAAAWEDPDHWSDEWREKLGVGADEVEDVVAALFIAAVEES